jgi:hypothetical protein
MNPHPAFEYLDKQLTFLILDYCRPAETSYLLHSIRHFVKFDNYEVVLLSNGGEQYYIWEMYEKGLIDKAILSRENEGSGFGTLRLSHFCQTPYFINFQCDNALRRHFGQEELDTMKAVLETTDAGAIDFAMVGKGVFSERAFMVNTAFYCENIFARGGGAGRFYELPSTEETMSKWLAHCNKTVHNWNPPLVADTGKYSIHQTKYGGTYHRRNDTGQLSWLKIPSQKEPILNLTDAEWDDILNKRWKNGRIPQNHKPFFFYSPELDPIAD